MKYSVKYKASAYKELIDIQEPFLSRIQVAIGKLQEQPRPVGSKKLLGGEME